jgi:transmembrane sensor
VDNRYQKIQQQAARWFARMQNAEPDHPERGSFEAWLMSSDLHAAAYSRLSNIWERFDSTSSLQAIASAAESSRHLNDEHSEKLRRRVIQGISCLALIAVSAVFGFQLWSANTPLMQMASRTEIGQVKKEVLEDGSELVINSDTEMTIRYYRDRRTVHIARGEVIFNVAKDAERPFIVDSDLAKVTVLGTRFVVNRLKTMVRVSVDHGRVKVENPQQDAESPLILTNGQVAEIPASQLPKRVERNAMDAFSFESGTIAFEEANLSEIAEVLSRHYGKRVMVKPSQMDPRVTALVQISNIDGFLRTLPRIAAVNVIEEQGRTTLSAR